MKIYIYYKMTIFFYTGILASLFWSKSHPTEFVIKLDKLLRFTYMQNGQKRRAKNSNQFITLKDVLGLCASEPGA